MRYIDMECIKHCTNARGMPLARHRGRVLQPAATVLRAARFRLPDAQMPAAAGERRTPCNIYVFGHSGVLGCHCDRVGKLLQHVLYAVNELPHRVHGLGGAAAHSRAFAPWRIFFPPFIIADETAATAAPAAMPRPTPFTTFMLCIHGIKPPDPDCGF